MTWMLDTDTVSYALRGSPTVVQRIREASPSSLCISSITLAELRYGASLKNSKKLQRLIDTFTSGVHAVPFDSAAAESYGKLAVKLRERGTPIGQMDTLIAAHCLSLGITLVSNNLRHFNKVPRLKVESWIERLA